MKLDFKFPKLTDRNKIILGFSAIAAGLLYWSYKAGKLDSALGLNSGPNVMPPPFPVLGPGDQQANAQSPLHKFMTSPSTSPAHKPIGKAPAIPPPIAMGKAAAQQIQGTLEQHQQAQQQAADQQLMAQRQQQQPGYAAPVAPTFGDWVRSNDQTSGWW